MKRILITFIVLAAAMLAGCGGGGGGGGDSTPPPQPKTATLKLSISGTPTQNLRGVTVSVTLPDGVTPALDNSGDVAAGVVTVSGVAAPGTVLTVVYTPASGLVNGKLLIPIATNNTAGFGVGEFATVTLNAAAGKAPVAADFTLGDFDPLDLLFNHVIAGLTPTISFYELK